MSFISPLDGDLALVYPRIAPVRLMEFLAERGIEIVEVPDESSSRWARTSSRSARGSTRAHGKRRDATAAWSVPAVEVLRTGATNLAEGRRRPDMLSGLCSGCEASPPTSPPPQLR